MSILLVHTRNLSRRAHLARVRDYAREHGERLLMIMRDPTWEANFVDRIIEADTSSIEETVGAARLMMAGEEEQLTGVMSLVEQSVPAVAAVAAEWELPSVGRRAGYLARDKHAMRMAFGAAGLAQPGFGLACSLYEARSVAARIGFPLVLKPLIGGGSKYVRRVSDAAELTEHFELIRRGASAGFRHDPLNASTRERYGDALLLEGYVAGSEISVESLVVDGETHVVAIHDKPLPMEGPFFEEIYYATPTRLPRGRVRTILAATAAAHRALEIDTGVTHTEFRVPATGEPIILEIGARMGGGPIYQSVLLSTGVDLVVAALDLARGYGLTSTVHEIPSPTGFYLFFAERAGKLCGVHGLEEVRADRRTREVDIYSEVGDEVVVPPHASSAHGHVVFCAATADGVDATFEEFRSAIRVEVQ